jgi:hypothetical protein
MPILRAARPFAILAVVAVLLGRAIGPSIAGIGVGMDRAVRAFELVGQVTSQCFAIAAVVFAMSELLAASRGRLPGAIRPFAVGLGGVVILVTLLASPRRESLPAVIVSGAAICAAVLALFAAASVARVPFARAAALVVGLTGLAGILRLGAIALAFQAEAPRMSSLLLSARVFATLAFFADVAAVLLVVAWIAARARKLTSPVTLVVLGLAMLLTRQALSADRDDVGSLTLLVRRAGERLLLSPAPLVPHAVALFLAFLALLAAVAALLAPDTAPKKSAPGGPPAPIVSAPTPPAIRAAVALALLARGAPEMPMNALLLVIAAITMALAARDDRGLWAAIGDAARGRASYPGPPR